LSSVAHLHSDRVFAEVAYSPEREQAPGLDDVRVVVTIEQGVTWVHRAGDQRFWTRDPQLCDCVLRALAAIEIEAELGFDLVWQPAAARRAENLLLYGPEAPALAQRLSHYRTRCRTVCCDDRDDAVRVARILALKGDTVLHEGDCIAIFSHRRCGYDQPSC